MYSYTKKRRFSKRKLIVALASVLVIVVAFLSYEYSLRKQPTTPVFQEESVPVLTLPANADASEKGKKPFSIEAKVVLDYFDGKDNEVESVTLFEGVYRANQGMDYAKDDEAFDVTACFSGKITSVKDDSMFGKTVVVTSDDLDITYQSLGEVSVKEGDSIKQGAILGKAGSNIYNKDLNHHVHIVVEKSGKIIDPDTIYDKTLEEIK